MTQTAVLIRDIVARIKPFDEVENTQISEVLQWIDSGAGLFRTGKPDIPRKHLVSYFLLLDAARDKLFLIDHVKAQAWLPAGGHVDPDEDPRVTAVREVQEELGLVADFGTKFGDDPLFLSAGKTKGYGEHTDVCLWYVMAADSTKAIEYDASEMTGYKWLTPAQILAMPIVELDPHLHRFVRKMQRLSR